MVIRCARCNKKLFKYYKKCPGKLWHLWKRNIIEDNTEREGDKVLCPKCGAVIGIDKPNQIKLIKGAYKY